MPAAMTVTENGTLVLDKERIAPLNANAGAPLSVGKLPDRSLIEISKYRPSVMDFAGCFKPKLHLSLEEIEEATAQAYLKEEMKGP